MVGDVNAGETATEASYWNAFLSSFSCSFKQNFGQIIVYCHAVGAYLCKIQDLLLVTTPTGTHNSQKRYFRLNPYVT